jgi:hypothetical protein
MPNEGYSNARVPKYARRPRIRPEHRRKSLNNSKKTTRTVQDIVLGKTHIQQDYTHKVPPILYDNLQRGSIKHYGPPASVTRLQLLSKQTNSGICTALIAETH